MIFIILFAFILFRYISLQKQKDRYENLYKNLIHQIDSQKDKNKEQQLVIAYQNRLAQKGQIFNIVAHQWRQPLNTLSILLERLYKAQNSSKLDAKLFQEIYNQMDSTIQHMSLTIEDFSDFFKPDKQKKEFFVDETIEKTLQILKPMLQKESIDLVEDIESPIKFMGYQNELGQVIINIVNNAKEAFLNKDISKKQITIELTQKDDVIKILICDNAGGIDEELLPKIFEPYFSTKEQKNGIGLGLYISKLIIQEHMGGSLYAKNYTHGASFIIELYTKRG